MRKDEMTMAGLLLEAVGVVAGVSYIGLQIFYKIIYDADILGIVLNIVTLLLLYVGLTLLQCYPERVNGLTREVCTGCVRRYTIQMVRFIKLIFIVSLLFTSICDVAGIQMNAGYSLIVAVLMIAVALFYEYKVIQILKKRK